MQTIAQTTFDSIISPWTGFLGGLAGLLVLGLELFRLWRDRKPRLRLFTPDWFVGFDAVHKKPVLNVLLRISNSSSRIAFLYLETMQVEIQILREWKQREVLETSHVEKISTDFPKEKGAALGLSHIGYLNRWKAPAVSSEAPLSGYVAMDYDAGWKACDLSGIRINVEDCHRRKHRLSAKLGKEENK